MYINGINNSEIKNNLKVKHPENKAKFSAVAHKSTKVELNKRNSDD